MGNFISSIQFRKKTSDVVKEEKKTSIDLLDINSESFEEAWRKTEIKPILYTLNNKLKFPVGHPKKKIVYVAHPLEEGTYFPFASFHRFLFEHKCSEAIMMLMSLGATKIEAIHKSGWGKDFALNMNLNIPIEGVPSKVTSKYESEKSASNYLIFKYNLEGTTKKPKLPNELMWYEYEPSWKQVARGRLEYGLKEFELQINYHDDNKVNSNIGASVLEYGLTLGGNLEEYKSTEWILKGEFKTS